MKVIITGASGRIGFELAEALAKAGNKVTGTFLNSLASANGMEFVKLDTTNRRDVLELIKKVKPELVIHTAALTNVDLCETDHKLADNLNVESTRNIVDGCIDVGSKIAYVSSSFVFDGSKKVFHEDDRPNPVNYYGKTKLYGEKIIEDSKLKFLILRTDQPYNWIKSWQKDNNVTRIIKKLENKESFKEFADWYNNPTFIPDFVKATLNLIKNERQGIYHLVGSDYMNRYEWALKIAEIFEKEKHLINPTDSKDLNLPAKRPNANLSNEKVQKDSGVKFSGLEQGLKNMLRNQKV